MCNCKYELLTNIQYGVEVKYVTDEILSKESSIQLLIENSVRFLLLKDYSILCWKIRYFTHTTTRCDNRYSLLHYTFAIDGIWLERFDKSCQEYTDGFQHGQLKAFEGHEKITTNFIEGVLNLA